MAFADGEDKKIEGRVLRLEYAGIFLKTSRGLVCDGGIIWEREDLGQRSKGGPSM